MGAMAGMSPPDDLIEVFALAVQSAAFYGNGLVYVRVDAAQGAQRLQRADASLYVRHPVKRLDPVAGATGYPDGIEITTLHAMSSSDMRAGAAS